jgi:hypothetical protein
MILIQMIQGQNQDQDPIHIVVVAEEEAIVTIKKEMVIKEIVSHQIRINRTLISFTIINL